MRHADRQRQGVHLPDHGDRFQEEFFDYEAKYTAGCSDEITPADIAPEIKAELNRLTALAYKPAAAGAWCAWISSSRPRASLT